MTAEDLLFHGRFTSRGHRVLEYPTYVLGKDGRYWNVLCSVMGNSGHMEKHSDALRWISMNIKGYVRLEDYQTLEAEINKLKAELAKSELTEIEHTGD